MKTLLPIFSLLLLSTALSAQIVDRDYPFYSFTEPEKVLPIGDGRWLVVGKLMQYSDDYGADSIFAVIFDRNHQTLLKQVLPLPPTERYYGLEAHVVDDNSFIIAVYRGGCDYSNDQAILQKYTVSGALEWSLQGEIAGEKLPSIWQVGPDGHLLGCYHNRLWKINANTGAIIWRANLSGFDPDAYIDFFALLPGTEDLLLCNHNKLQIWKQSNGPNAPVYLLENSILVDGSGWRSGQGFAPNGWYYTINLTAASAQLERYSPSLTQDILIDSQDWKGLRQVAIANDGLYALGRNMGQNWLRKTDFSGQNPVEIPMPDWWLRGHSLAVQNDTVVIAGADGSGPKSTPNDPSFSSILGFQTQHLWVRTFSGLSPTPSNDSSNAAVTEIIKLAPVYTVQYASSDPSQPPYYTIEGGDFQIEITNKGNVLLQEVCLNFGYEEDRIGICFHSAHLQHRYTNLNLAPGASMWLDFGNLVLQRQSSLANEHCFWTSAPNNMPDTHHEDDYYCIPDYFLVDIHTPNNEHFSLLPNPAQDYFRVINAANSGETEWHLYTMPLAA